MFGKEIEETKRFGHLVCTSKTSKERRLNLKLLLRHITKVKIIAQEKDGINLQRLERLEQLEQLGRLRRLQLCNQDYRDLVIPAGAVVYCDPPYENTVGYKDSINHGDFWQWVRELSKTNFVYVSSYNAPDDMTIVLPVLVKPLPAKITPADENCTNVTLFTPSVPPGSIVHTQPVSALTVPC